MVLGKACGTGSPAVSSLLLRSSWMVEHANTTQGLTTPRLGATVTTRSCSSQTTARGRGRWDTLENQSTYFCKAGPVCWLWPLDSIIPSTRSPHHITAFCKPIRTFVKWMVAVGSAGLTLADSFSLSNFADDSGSPCLASGVMTAEV